MVDGIANAAARVLGENGLAFLALLHSRHAELEARWSESDELLEAYAVLESQVGELAPVIARIENALPTLDAERLPSAYVWLGHLLAISGSRERASLVLAEAEARCSSDWMRGRIAQDRSMVVSTERMAVDAERDLRSAISFYEKSGDHLSACDAQIYIAQAYCGQGKGPEALDMILSRVDSIPRGGLLELRASLELARGYREKVDVERVDAMCARVEELAPPDLFDPAHRIAFHRGEMAWWREDWVNAIAHFESAVRLCQERARPSFEANLYYTLALVAFDSGDFDRAAQWLEKTFELGQKLSYSSLVAGAKGVDVCVKAARGDREGALRAYRAQRPTYSNGVAAVYMNGMSALAELLLAALAVSDDERASFDAAAARNMATLRERDEHGVPWLERNFALRVLARRLVKYAEPRGLAHLVATKPKVSEVDIHGTFIRFENGETVSFARRHVLVRILSCLARHAAERPGERVSSVTLFAAGWPEDRATEESLILRLRVAIAALRQLGLDEKLVTHENGYSLRS